MADTAEFTIGAEAKATDGPVGKVSRVVVNPVAKALTHLVVETGLRAGPDRLVPLDLVDGGGAAEVQLRCTKAQFENLEPAEETEFIPRTTSFGSYGAGDVLSWPYYGAAGIGDLDGIGGAGGMATEDGWTRPEVRGTFEPSSCVGAVFSSMAGSYDNSGYREFYEVRQSDMSGGAWPHWVDQGVAAFENDAQATSFVTKQVAQWRQCADRQFRYAYPRPDDWQDPYRIGHTIDSGCVTMISNVIADDKHYTDIRALAARSNIVVDLQFTGFDLTDEPATAINRILDRIASRGHDCAFWG